MQTIVLIGENIQHSLSPLIQNKLINEHKLDYVYKLFEVNVNQLKEVTDQLRSKEFIGANVTSPYKIEIIKYLDSINIEAESVGSVNTIVKENGKLIGYNTDVYGFHKSIDENEYKNYDSVGIIGSGGAARAVLKALSKYNCKKNIYVFSSDIVKAKKLKLIFKEFDFKIVSFDNHFATDLLINATPLGKYNFKELNITDTELIKVKFLYDLNYFPDQTDILIHASKLGCKIKNGLDMLYFQAYKSFQLWTEVV